MKEPVPQSVFLERRSYRRRRMMDALRLLPVLGAMLWLLPLFWRASPAEGTEGVPMSNAVIYVFLVWFLLIGASYLLWRGLWRNRLSDGEDEDAP